MAYTTQAQLEAAAGGAAALLELASDGEETPAIDPAVLAQAQAAADAEIDSRARRLYGTVLPFGTVAPFLTVPPQITSMAAEETVYRLRMYKRILGDTDTRLREIREDRLDDLEAGRLIPPPDPYPIGDGGGTPAVIARTIDTSDANAPSSRDSMKGMW